MFPLVEADDSLEEQIKMASQEESVREFVAVTDVDEERARFFLESAGWNLQVRLFCGGTRGRARRGIPRKKRRRREGCQANG